MRYSSGCCPRLGKPLGFQPVFACVSKSLELSLTRIFPCTPCDPWIIHRVHIKGINKKKLKTTNKQVDIQVILLSLHSKPLFQKWRFRKNFHRKRSSKYVVL